MPDLVVGPYLPTLAAATIATMTLPAQIVAALPATLEPYKRRARDAYEAAADRYDDAALGFWARAGERTIARLALEPGMHVLDLASGTGASALPAAEAVGPGGRVVAVDLAQAMLERGREKARRAGIDHIEWVRGDMVATRLPAASFDAVVCVFGVSMAPDMPAFVRELWRLVRPGGRLAVTTWGPRLWAPMYDVWRASVLEEWPQLGDDFHAWDRVTDPTSVARLLGEAGIPGRGMKVVPEFDRWPLRSPHDWWTIVMGSGLRWTMEQLTPEARARVRERNLAYVRDHRVEWLACNVLYATALKG
jgi:ubiquinone/menaquinone biosynthesis C-methylase UbiE